MIARLSLFLLGPLEIRLDGEPLDGFEYNKVRALLAYLALQSGYPQTRAGLCALLWPEMPEPAARQNLSQALSQLRKVLREKQATTPFLLANVDSVQLNPAAPPDVDTARFTALIASAEAHPHREWRLCSPCASKLQQAVSIYRGDFLAHFYLGDSAAFEEWALLLRERLRQQMLSALERLARYFEWRGAYQQAVEILRKHVDLEPWQDGSQRELMRLLALSGQRSAALAQYDHLKRALDGELGVEPEPATTELVETIRADGSFDALRRLRPPDSHLPALPLPLIGRAMDLDVVEGLLTDGVRLLTVTGAPGVGKTRLALEVASRMRFDFEDGVAFVDLAPAPDATHAPPALAQALGVKEQGGRTAAESVKGHLRSQHTLLVLDNFEHILDAAPFVADLLAACPTLTLLVTSRSALHIRAEYIHLLAPLEGAEAVQLFADRARGVRTGFALTEENAEAVATLCRQLDNLPLGIELVAVRARTFSPAELLRQLGPRLESLAAGSRDLPERQSTLRNAIAWSYDRLNAGEQFVFAHLGVFLGGCTVEAVQAVVGEALPVPPLLEALVEASLVQSQITEQETRFTLLETIREFALEQLAAREEAGAARRQHAQFYAGLAATAERHFKTPQMGQWMDRLERELDNVWAAVRWHRLHAAGPGLAVVSRLARFWQVRGHMREALAWLEELLNHPGNRENPAPTLQERARGALVAGSLSLRLHDYPKAQGWFEESLRLYRQPNDSDKIAVVLSNLGIIALDQGRYAEAERLFRESREASASTANTWNAASATNNLGEALRLQYRLVEARACFADSAALYRQTGDISSAASATNNMAAILRQLGDHAEARRLSEESYQLFSGLGDKRRMAYARQNLAQAEEAQGEIDLARRHYREAVRYFFEVELQADTLMSLLQLGNLEFECGSWPAERLVLLLSRTAAFIQASEISLEPEGQLLYDRLLQKSRDAMNPMAFHAGWQSGQTLALEQAVAQALRDEDEGASAY